MKRLVAVAVLMLVVLACTEGLPTESPAGNLQSRWEHLMSADSLTGKCFLWPPLPAGISDCPSANASVTPMNHQCYADCHNSMPQLEPVHIVFNKPVYEVDVMSEGNYWCSSADKGVATYYRQGKAVEVGKLGLVDSLGECLFLHEIRRNNDTYYAADSMAEHAIYRSTYKGPIDSIVVTRPAPDSVVLDWPPFLNLENGIWQVADISANYSFYLFEQPGDQAADCLASGNDPFINRQTVRDLFKQLWDSSGTSLPAPQRTERGAWVYEDTANGGLIVVPQPFNSAKDNACFSEWPFPGGVGGIPLFHVHTHPFLRGDIMPGYCWGDDATPSKPGTYNPRIHGGASEPDLKIIGQYGFPEYIVDSSHVYAVPPTATLRNASGVTKSFPRHKSNPSCDLF